MLSPVYRVVCHCLVQQALQCQVMIPPHRFVGTLWRYDDKWEVRLPLDDLGYPVDLHQLQVIASFAHPVKEEDQGPFFVWMCPVAWR